MKGSVGMQMLKIYHGKRGREDGEKGGLSNTLPARSAIRIIITLSIF